VCVARPCRLGMAEGAARWQDTTEWEMELERIANVTDVSRTHLVSPIWPEKLSAAWHGSSAPIAAAAGELGNIGIGPDSRGRSGR
jgi:hypothetical protein